MLNKTILIASLLASVTAQSNNSYSLNEAKKVLTEKEYKQYSHEVWESQRKKSEVTDYSELLKNNQGGNTLTAGPGNDCGFPNILTAINFAAPGDTIMIAEGTYTGVEAKLTINKSLSLIGGLDSNCQVFTLNRTHLELNDLGPVLDINVSGGKTVLISGLDISGAQHDNLADYDGGIYVYGDGTLTIENSHIHNNESYFGAGISLRENATLNLSNNTEIYNNSSISDGGGIFCSSSDINAKNIKIGRKEGEQVQGNISTQPDSKGAAIAAYSCGVYLGNSPLGTGAVEINYNLSNNAAVYLNNSALLFSEEGSQMKFNGNPEENQSVYNTALLADNSAIQLTNVEITDNYLGTVIEIENESDLSMYSDCKGKSCSKLSRNAGIALFVNLNSTAYLQQTIISDNLESPLLVTSVEPDALTLTNVLISNNSRRTYNNLITGTSNTHMTLNNVTIANNGDDIDAIFKIGQGGTIDFNGGVIWNNAPNTLINNEGNGITTISNSIIQYNSAGMTNTIQTDPMFVNQDNNDFRLLGESPAIDHFNTNNFIDIIGNVRPQGMGTDAGAYEWTDLIFKNDFEEL